jgi:molecular chaperone DnaK (HSP70)
MPQVKKRLDQEFGCDAKFNDPDQCVAKGAAIYAMNEAYSQAVEEYNSGDRDEKPQALKGPRARVVNVTSKTYGTDFTDGDGRPMVKNIIFANSSLPTKNEETFSTMYDNQKNISIKVYESDFTSPETDVEVEERFCTMLEDRSLTVTQNWPKGTNISVQFEVNNEGILSVHASIGQEDLDFSLTIKGVKSDDELDASKEAISKTTVS